MRGRAGRACQWVNGQLGPCGKEMQPGSHPLIPPRPARIRDLTMLLSFYVSHNYPVNGTKDSFRSGGRRIRDERDNIPPISAGSPRKSFTRLPLFPGHGVRTSECGDCGKRAGEG